MWARIIIYGGFLAIVAICAYLAWSTMLSRAPDSWLGAAFGLFAAIFPLMIVILIASTIHTGVKAIREQTDHFLIGTVPSILARLPECETTFMPHGAKFRSAARVRFAAVEISHKAGDCFADYRLQVDRSGRPQKIRIRIELNVHRMNFNLYLPIDRIDQLHGSASQTKRVTRELLRETLFPHSLDAASAQIADNEIEAASLGGYMFHEEIIQRELEQRRWYVLVGSCGLAKDLLWNPAERLFVAQDLMFMLRAMVNEAPEVFFDES